jgi:phytoene/squalene synthetase
VTENIKTTPLGDEVRQYDYDRWLTCLMAPEAAREGLFALLSFNSEIARVRETVSEPMLGDIRLQWWRDALKGLAVGTPKTHPTVAALHRLNKETPLNIGLMQEMVDMRSKDLDPVPLSSDGELLVYADQTAGALQQLIFKQLGGPDTSGNLEAVVRTGRAYALFGILRAIPYHCRNGLVLLPSHRLAQYDMNEHTLLLPDHKENLHQIIQSISELAAEELVQAKKQAKQITGGARAALLLNALSPLYMMQLRKYGFDPTSPAMGVGSVRKILALTRYKLLGF